MISIGQILMAIDEYLQSKGVRTLGPSKLTPNEVYRRTATLCSSVSICDQTGMCYAIVFLGDDYVTVKAKRWNSTRMSYGQVTSFDLADPRLFDQLYEYALECYGDKAASILRIPEDRHVQKTNPTRTPATASSAPSKGVWKG